MRLPAVLDAALARLEGPGDASYEELLHEQGISTSEGLALLAAVEEQTQSKREAAMIGLLAGLLIGRGLEGQPLKSEQRSARGPGAPMKRGRPSRPPRDRPP
jgi:hypothetical protein